MDERNLQMLKCLCSDLDGIRAGLKVMQKACSDDLIVRALGEHIAMLEVDIHMAMSVAEDVAPAKSVPVSKRAS